MVPPLVGVAVKTTAVPLMMVLSASSLLSDTDGVRLGLTVVVMVVEVAVAVVTQVSELVMTTFTTSLLASVVVEKVAEFAPTLTSFSFH